MYIQNCSLGYSKTIKVRTFFQILTCNFFTISPTFRISTNIMIINPQRTTISLLLYNLPFSGCVCVCSDLDLPACYPIYHYLSQATFKKECSVLVPDTFLITSDTFCLSLCTFSVHQWNCGLKKPGSHCDITTNA